MQADVFRRQVEILDRAAVTLSEMVHELRRRWSTGSSQEQNFRLQQYESEADKLMHELLGELYNGQHRAWR